MAVVRSGITPESRKFVHTEVGRQRNRLRFFSNTLTELENSPRALQDSDFVQRIRNLQNNISFVLGMVMNKDEVSEDRFEKFEEQIQAIVAESQNMTRSPIATSEFDAPFTQIN